jgi:fumarate reductase subunit C
VSARIARTGPRKAWRKRTSTWWWLGRGSYFFFVMREMSSVFVAWTIIYILLLTRAVSHGDVAYEQFMAWSAHPLVILVQAVTLLFLLIHTITWFQLVPRVMVVDLGGGRKIPPAVVAGSNYLAWIVVTAVAAWVVLGG